MTIRWTLLPASELPAGDAWLGPDERKVLAGFRFRNRRSDWRLGRFVAKRAVSSFASIDDTNRIQILAAEDGAPEAWIDGRKGELGISISHREGLAACVVSDGAAVGCDLEAVEPRSSRFVNDFFTEQERIAVEATAGALRDRHVALTWSAKESALKVLRVGLRRDTRSVEVEIEKVEAAEAGWHPLRATVSPEGRAFLGWWRQEAQVVLTVASDDERQSIAN
ncbi:MAG: 4'-phosphopantetheinyl transferase superfamily protein [Deltaproteobacteria bacterium]|nr:4'-phosphopantetheinyl transferase superfamily protein [Deltaproteobacteria bacterium]NND28072.1 4'-phosphopantetheinyl transferase superfamily protein [Myxococcales bacterium]MBT8465707.1 4'-phosphopantetheinyl transferase superfamily protein [Deltaproteobacteria bacterium]MBT8481431.1 4'-phosphopantetheinyl transferase superfamily protein [Deltaproteobacteria bacterium]NNK44247.1 4'-phosphopantetheinyl transferase superfamily protein [Myxococcales bacterium]